MYVECAIDLLNGSLSVESMNGDFQSTIFHKANERKKQSYFKWNFERTLDGLTGNESSVGKTRRHWLFWKYYFLALPSNTKLQAAKGMKILRWRSLLVTHNKVVNRPNNISAVYVKEYILQICFVIILYFYIKNKWHIIWFKQEKQNKCLLHHIKLNVIFLQAFVNVIFSIYNRWIWNTILNVFNISSLLYTHTNIHTVVCWKMVLPVLES